VSKVLAEPLGIGVKAGTHVKAGSGKVTFTDGPYAEAKETIVSFALIDVRSKEEAIERVPARLVRDVGLADELAQDALVETLEKGAADRAPRQSRWLADGRREAPRDRPAAPR
jgi:YCII-related domain